MNYELTITFALSNKKTNLAANASQRDARGERTPEQQAIASKYVNEVFAIAEIITNIVNPLVNAESDWGEGINPRQIGWYLKKEPDVEEIKVAVQGAVSDLVVELDVYVGETEDDVEQELEDEFYLTQAKAAPVIDRVGQVWKNSTRTITVVSSKKDKHGQVWHKAKVVPPYLLPDKNGLNNVHEDPLHPWGNQSDSTHDPLVLVSKGSRHSN